MKTIAISNQKGGVAKTTTAINLAHGLVRKGFKVLLIDLDSQANTTESLPIDMSEVASRGVYEVLNRELSVVQAVRNLDANFDLLPSHIKLAKLEPMLNGAVDAYRLKDALAEVKMDYVVIDCPPSLGPLTQNALIAASHVVIPVKPAYFGLSAVSDFLETCEQIKRRLNPNLTIVGILVTQYDPRTKLAQDVTTELVNRYGDLVFQTRIQTNIRLDEATSAKLSIFSYDPRSSGAINYASFVDEVLARG
jgi:chromosome partitioning protein